MANWEYKGIFPAGAEDVAGSSFWGFSGIRSYAGNPMPAGIVDAVPANVTTPGRTEITVYAVNTVAYQWQESADGRTWQDIPGATKTTISREYQYSAESAGTYYFRCLCIGWLGTVATDPAIITVRNHAPTAEILPASAAIQTPADLLFSAAAEYTEAMQWQRSRGSDVWEDIEGATADEYTAQFVYGDGGLHFFRMKASGLGGTALSNIARITVTDPEPVISISADLPEIIYVGDTIKFTAAAEYTDMVEWQRFIGGAWMKIPDAADLEYNHVCDIGQVYSIRCVAVGRGGTTISNIIALDVKYPAPTAAVTADKAELIIGEAATLTAATTWAASLKWQHSTDGTAWQDITGETEETLHVVPETGGQHYYRAEVLGMDGSIIHSNQVGIMVYIPPTIQISADKTELTTGETATLTAEATDYTSLIWQQRSGEVWTAIPGAGDLSYAFTPTTAGTFDFRCEAIGRGGTAISNEITITATDPEPEPPEP